MSPPTARRDLPTDSSLTHAALRAARRDSFVALLAHEIRNPLAPIRNGVALLRSGRIDEGTQSATLSMMERQVAHLVRLVDDLLASVSVRNGEPPASAERVRLVDVLNAAVESVRPAILAKRQVVSLIGSETTAMVDADPKRLAQAFCNLLNASSKKTPWNGRLVVEVATRGDLVEIRFSDDGVCIPAEELVDVFELFARPSAAVGETLGIGLALVRGLVELNGGTVDAIDDPATAGTVFIVKLPLRGVDAKGPADRSPPLAARWRSRRVLVVDDNRDAAQTLGALLELEGHTIRLAHDGPSAVAEAQAFVPEVILMDIGLPGYSGLVATQKIRRMTLSVRPLIVALTGWGSAADRESTHVAGCDLHLVKPVDYREVAQALALAPRVPQASP